MTEKLARDRLLAANALNLTARGSLEGPSQGQPRERLIGRERRATTRPSGDTQTEGGSRCRGAPSGTLQPDQGQHQALTTVWGKGTFTRASESLEAQPRELTQEEPTHIRRDLPACPRRLRVTPETAREPGRRAAGRAWQLEDRARVLVLRNSR